ncbi:prepilin-type N-terminal cleavage/methylation domain-containing protein [Ramlibacter sp. AN1015]|uniref:prepilin-type N-terminal cleavage/methylation domain-containing protein n=1 Tax=Ramlibacter sp. AN1015 TaxID=3133428 RepID=UPI0030BE83D4
MKHARFSRSCQRGVGLVELMVALLVGLLLLTGVLGAYLSQRLAYRTHESLARLQENGRFAFELMMREVRDAGQLPCGAALTANVLRKAPPAVTYWWADTDAGMVRGFDGVSGAGVASNSVVAVGTATSERIASTDALLLLRPTGADQGVARIAAHDPATGTLSAAADNGVESDDIALLCDPHSSALFQISTSTSSGKALSYRGAPSLNCTTDLGAVVAPCTDTHPKTFEAGAIVARWEPAFWYIGANGRGSRSLYRATIHKSGATPGSRTIQTAKHEMVPDIDDLQIDYLRRLPGGDLASTWESAAAITSWNDPDRPVLAVRARLTLVANDGAGSLLARSLVAVAALRNAQP